MTMSMRTSCVLSLACCVLGVRPSLAAPASIETVAVVGGVPITRAKLHQYLEGVYGEQALPQLIEAQLLSNALLERGLSVSNAEVDAELARLELQDPNVKTMMNMGGARVGVIGDQVRRNLTMQKLLTSRVAKPTDAQLRAFFNQFSSYYGTPVQNKLGLLAASTKTRANHLARALKDNPDSFAALVQEQKQSKDLIAMQLSNAESERFEAPDEFGASFVPPQLLPQIEPSLAPIRKALASAKKGQVLPVQALSPQGPYLIVKVVDHKNAVTANLATTEVQVETDYKMAQVALAEIRKNPTNPQKLEDNIKAVAQSLAQQALLGTRLSLRDILTAILRPASDNSLNFLRAHAKITIIDPSLGTGKSSSAEDSTTNAVDNSDSSSSG